MRELRVPRLSVKDLSTRRFDVCFYARSCPVLIEDAASDWQALDRWDFGYLAAVLGEKLVTVKYNENGVFDFNEGATTGAVEDRELTVAHALELMQGKDGFRYYLLNRDIRKRFPQLLRDIEVPSMLDVSKRLSAVNLWLGGAGTKSALHYDSMDNLLVQVTGRKRVMLFPPTQAINLYPARRAKYPHISRVNVFERATGRFPLAEKARRCTAEVTLMPGSALYLPPFWWHAVESLDLSSSVNFWWLRTSASAWLKQVCFPSSAQLIEDLSLKADASSAAPPSDRSPAGSAAAAVSPPPPADGAASA